MSVTAIIPAYNESKTIGDVLRVAKSVPLISEILVISDGSTDDTADIARNYGVHVIEHAENLGKSESIKTGLDISSFETILLLDADLIGLKADHIHDLLIPVINNEYDMTVGIFKSGRRVTDLAQKIAPKLSGQRAIKKCLLEKIKEIDLTSYGLEVALTKLIDSDSYRVGEIYLYDVTHLTKEEKMGMLHGFSSRMKMYWDIVKIIKKDIR